MAIQIRYPTANRIYSYTLLTNPERLYVADRGSNPSTPFAINSASTGAAKGAAYYGFGFNIPDGSTINSVKVQSGYAIQTTSIGGGGGYVRWQPLFNDASRGSYYGHALTNAVTKQYVEYEWTSDGVFTAAELNDDSITGFALHYYLSCGYSSSFTQAADYIRVVVDYTPPDNVAEFNTAEAAASIPPQVFNEQGGTFDALGRAAIAGANEFGLPLMDYGYATPVAEYVLSNESEVAFDTATAAADGLDFTIIVGIAPAAEPFSLQLYATETGLPITTLYEFENLTYSRSENEAGQVQITFPANHPANKAIRDIYTAEPHGIYGILYRRGEAWAGVILAETDITTSPISWSFLTFEALLREHKTPWKWHGLEGLTIQQALTALCEKGLKWHQVASAEGLAAATLSDTEIKTWAQLAGEVESGAYNQPMIVLGKTGTHYKTSGTATFAWDFGDQVPLDRIRWRCSLGEYVSLAVQYRCSPDNVSWTSYTDEAAVADQDYAETYGIAAAGTYRYLEVKFTLRTEDTTTKDQAGVEVGTSPVLFGVEVLTSYDTGIDAYSIDVADEALKRGFDFSHENHLAAIASICEDYGYSFRVDEQKRLYVWQPAATAPVIVKKGETCEPTAISYQGLSDIQNSLTCYGAGEGLGRLSTLAEDATSIAIYGRRPGIFEDSKITTLTALQAAAADELYKRAYPVLEAQIRAPYEPGRGVLDARLHDYVLYIDPETFTGSDNLGQALFEVTAESREFTADGEMVTLGLNSSLDDMFTREAKDGVRSRYKRGKAVGQVPFDVRAIAGFAAINILWHGIAPEYIVEYSSTGTDGWKALARTTERSYLHSQLGSGATFYYRVRAVYNGTEITGPSLIVSATTTLIDPGDLDTTAPAVPTGLAASTGTTQSTAGGIVMLNTLTWNAVVATDLSFYELKRSIDEIAWITAAIVPAGEITFIDTAGLVENTTYYYQIRSVDKVGNRSDWSASASVTTVKDAVAPTFAATAPEVLVGYKRLVPSWAGSSSLDISHYILQRQEAPAEWDSEDDVYAVPTTPVPGEWAAITGAAIRALQFHDTEVDFDTCYRYKVAAVDTSGNTSAYTSESAWAVPSQIGTADIAYRKITAEMYGELRQTMPYMWHQDIDATHPVEVPFYIPSETTQIVSIKLSAYGERFRANSTGAAAGGSHSHTVELADHTHTIYENVVVGDTEVADGHTHEYIVTYVSSATEEGGGTTETSSNQDAHTHDITYGIYESTTPAGVNLYIDNGAGYGSAIPLASAPVSTTERYELAEELDITAHIAGTGWKRLKLTSTRLGSVEMQLICKVDITA